MEVTYLEYVISENGLKPDPQKIQPITEFPAPWNAENVNNSRVN